MMSAIFYVSATVSSDGNFASCTYYSDKEGQTPVSGSSFSIPKNAGTCIFEQTTNSPLVLIGASFSSLGGAPALNSGNFCPADSQNAISFAMSTSFISTKGIVLLFSNPDVVDGLYPSSDPQVTNDGAMPPTNGDGAQGHR